MEKSKYIDHTLLKVESTWADIKQIVDDGMKYDTASVCIPASFVKQAADYIKEQGGHLKVCTVIGFPLGMNLTRTKVDEARLAIQEGAEEIDMVINVGMLKAGHDDYVKEEIKLLKEVAGKLVLKVIIETCLLTDEEKVRVCRLAKEAGADFVKTSTGFSTGGATAHDVKLMRETVGPEMGVKASGGVRTHEDLLAMVEAGANRIGTSNGTKII